MEQKKWTHIMFSTNKGEALIIKEHETAVFDCLAQKLTELNCAVKAINGMPDHVHLLFELNQLLPIHEIVYHVKESSRKWINEQGLLAHDFNWQKGSGVFSINQTEMKKLSIYIRNQKEIHQTLTFKEEYMTYFKLNLI